MLPWLSFIVLGALACIQSQCFRWSPASIRRKQNQQPTQFFAAVTEATASLFSLTNTTDSFTTSSASSQGEDIAFLLQQAEELREEASSLQKALNESRIEKQHREEAKVDKWIGELFVQCRIDNQTELLKTVDQAVERLRDDRYSQEQVNKIFKRICQTRSKQSRSNHSPIMALLVEAVGKMDDVDRPEQENKRWSGRVEQMLQRKLFAADWGIELADQEEEDRKNPWKLK